MYEACFRVSLKHASFFKKVRLKGLFSHLHMYLSNACRTAANRILRSTSTIPTARKRCCFWVRGLTLFYSFERPGSAATIGWHSIVGTGPVGFCGSQLAEFQRGHHDGDQKYEPQHRTGNR